MLKIYLRIESEGYLHREHISAWIFNKLSKTYHDEGVEKYFNGSGVKAHNFNFNYNKLLKRGTLELVEVRGISLIENRLMSVLKNGDKVYLGKVKASVYLVELEDYVHKSIYEIKSPLIMRHSNLSSDLKSDLGYPTFVPSMGKEEFENKVCKSIIQRANKIYGYLDSELKGINLIDYREVYAQLNIKGLNMVYLSVLGNIELDGDDFWHDFIQRVGLGNRNTYGFGVIG